VSNSSKDKALRDLVNKWIKERLHFTTPKREIYSILINELLAILDAPAEEVRCHKMITPASSCELPKGHEGICWPYPSYMAPAEEVPNQAMRALESLTCGGSEFVGEIDACVAYVRKKISTLQDIAKNAVKQKNELLTARIAPAEEVGEQLPLLMLLQALKNLTKLYELPYDQWNQPNPGQYFREAKAAIVEVERFLATRPGAKTGESK
jgi:hypothetical protein